MTKNYYVTALYMLVRRFSPGNVWTPLWETAARTTSDYNAAVQGGRDCQVKLLLLLLRKAG